MRNEPSTIEEEIRYAKHNRELWKRIIDKEELPSGAIANSAQISAAIRQVEACDKRLAELSPNA